MKTKKLIFTALFTALCCVGTMVIKFPTPLGGYIHVGDAMVVLSGFLLGPLYGAFAAGVGSALADAISGYFIYVPATLIIKALVALIAALLLRGFKSSHIGFRSILAGAIGGIFMMLGYFAFEAVVLGFGMAAAVDMPTNALQGAFGAVAASVLYISLMRSAYVRQYLSELRTDGKG